LKSDTHGTTKLEDLASVYQQKFGKPKGNAPSFLFSLLHAFCTRDVERWNHMVNNVRKPDLAVRNAAQLAKSAEKLTPLLLKDMSTVMLTHRRLSPMEIFHHVCFAKAMWKARCAAVWHTDHMTPYLICTFFWEAVGRHKKPSPTLTIRDLIPSWDVDRWFIIIYSSLGP